MKNMILFLLVIVFATVSCEEEEIKQETSIYGTWQLEERVFDSIIGNSEIEQVSNGYLIEFSRDKSYWSTDGAICPSNPSNLGTFDFLNENGETYITVNLVCEENDGNIFSIKYLYSFEGNNLYLSPTSTCFEGCTYKFKKISEPQEAE